MTINNQKEYWDKVANTKTFTHPLDMQVISNLFNKDFEILDYGCGYGRLTNEFNSLDFTNIEGVDTSRELIKRGQMLYPHIQITHIKSPIILTLAQKKYDAILLFAVLTCIPSNTGQMELIRILRNKLKPGGLIYISDYYLQTSRSEVKEYEHLNDDTNNYGVFSLPEGATFRHHTKEWINELLDGFKIVSNKMVEVKTMNGHVAEAFQIVASI